MSSSRTRTQLWLAYGLVTGVASGTVMLASTGSIWWVVYLPPILLMAGLTAGSSRTWHEKERRGRSVRLATVATARSSVGVRIPTTTEFLATCGPSADPLHRRHSNAIHA